MLSKTSVFRPDGTLEQARLKEISSKIDGNRTVISKDIFSVDHRGWQKSMCGESFQRFYANENGLPTTMLYGVKKGIF